MYMYFWDHHQPVYIINCSQTYRSTGHCTCIFVVAISKPWAESQGLLKPSASYYFLGELHVYFHSEHEQVNTSTVLTNQPA